MRFLAQKKRKRNSVGLYITLSTFSLISLFKLQHTYQRHDIACLCWKCHVKPQSHYQSINQSIHNFGWGATP